MLIVLYDACRCCRCDGDAYARADLFRSDEARMLMMLLICRRYAAFFFMPRHAPRHAYASRQAHVAICRRRHLPRGIDTCHAAAVFDDAARRDDIV